MSLIMYSMPLSNPIARFLLAGLMLFALATLSLAQRVATNDEYVRTVWQRVLAATRQPEQIAWPPVFEIDPGEEINAYAMRGGKADGQAAVLAKVVIYRGMLEQIIERNPDRLAFILGHELAHVELGHILARPAGPDTNFLQVTFSREHEIDADRRGMEIALAAGYSFQGGISGIRKMIDKGLTYSSFEGLGVGHPSWYDRLTLLDSVQASLWRAMSAFETGAVFLCAEQYLSAENCYSQVVAEFPKCHEAWANLGYARLMQYCDALDPDDIRQFPIGLIACGGFFRRPESIEQRPRGIDHKLWQGAVEALQTALRLAPDSPLIKANLGIAYLVTPNGTNAKQATRYLQDAVTGLVKDTTLHYLTRAAIYTNAGVAELTVGERQTAALLLQQAEEARTIAARKTSGAADDSLTPALLYNRALYFSSSEQMEDRQQARIHFERYLNTANPTSPWWVIGYERYAELCKKLGTIPKKPAQLRQRAPLEFRPVVSITTGAGATISLTDSMERVLRVLGPAVWSPVAKGMMLKRYRYAETGLEILGAREVVAICLSGEKAPAVQLRKRGVGGKTQLLHIGMARDDLEEMLADVDYDFRQIDDSETNYRFYKRLGVAVRLRNGVVAEIIVIQIPEKQ